jgi:hypothetical protein
MFFWETRSRVFWSYCFKGRGYGGPSKDPSYHKVAYSYRTSRVLEYFWVLQDIVVNLLRIIHARIAGSFTSLLKKNSFVWNEEATLAFSLLKDVMSSTPVLITLDFGRTFIVECDAFG